MTVVANDAVAWNENPFIRCIAHVAERINPGSSSGMKAHLMRDEVDVVLDDYAEMNMVVELPQST